MPSVTRPRLTLKTLSKRINSTKICHQCYRFDHTLSFQFITVFFLACWSNVTQLFCPPIFIITGVGERLQAWDSLRSTILTAYRTPVLVPPNSSWCSFQFSCWSLCCPGKNVPYLIMISSQKKGRSNHCYIASPPPPADDGECIKKCTNNNSPPSKKHPVYSFTT